MLFAEWRSLQANKNHKNKDLIHIKDRWHTQSRKCFYQYMATSCNLPIIQDPQDICMLSDLIWDFRPDLIIETGVARGGSLVHHAQGLAALNFIDLNKDIPFSRKVLGIDIEIRDETKEALDRHPLKFMFETIEGSSIDVKIAAKVKKIASDYEKVMVVLDSNHEENHVLSELEIYSRLVSFGMPLFVMDTGIEFAPKSSFSETRPWSVGSNPYTAVMKFLQKKSGKKFVLNDEYEKRYLLTSSPSGLLIKK